ncbi:Hypothetical predicted protein [Mytilus galloprovincialis]|uniref:Uncharacterized protein n=1 Tax=Mytilus galloprovincialis TaxID=29158 RepID=A0A8B6CVG7_MYTGA|nr:Hypothetical predicted protein [Mytilus galloprovincialis]
MARGHTTRFLVPYARTSTYRHSFFPDSIMNWNSLPQTFGGQYLTRCFQAGVGGNDVSAGKSLKDGEEDNESLIWAARSCSNKDCNLVSRLP